LLAWHVPFYQQLYQLPAKTVCGRCIAEWFMTNTPPGSAYVLSSAFVRREVPGFYPTPGRFGTAVPMHASREEYHRLAAFLQDVMRRFPDLYFVDVQQELFGEGAGPERVEWLRRTFRRHARIENPALVRLSRMGMFPSSAFYPDMAAPSSSVVDTVIHSNTTDDLLTQKREAGESSLALFGPEWAYVEAPVTDTEWGHFKALHAEGRVFVHGLRDKPFRAQVSLHCVSYGVAQEVRVEMTGETQVLRLDPGALRWWELGELTIQPGENAIRVVKLAPQQSNEVANLLVAEIKIEPVADSSRRTALSGFDLLGLPAVQPKQSPAIPVKSEQVEHRPRQAFQVRVLRPAVLTRAMIDRHLLDLSSVQLEVGGQEPMHAVQRRKIAGTFAAERLETATGVHHAVVRDPVADNVGYARTQPPGE
jgi:hypothetical protein